MTGWQYVDGSHTYRATAMVRQDDGSVLLVGAYDASSNVTRKVFTLAAGGTQYRAGEQGAATILSADASTYLVRQPTSTSHYPHATALVSTPTGVISYAWRTFADDGRATIVAHVRPTGGDFATLDVGDGSVIGDPIDLSTYSLGILSAAYRDGQVLLVAQLRRASGNARDTFRQYASDDGGHSFELVEEWSDTSGVGGHHPNVLADTAGFHFLWIDLADGKPYYCRVGSAYTSLFAASRTQVEDAVWADVASDDELVQSGSATVCQDETGTFYALGLVRSSNVDAHMRLSTDGGRTWIDPVDGVDVTGSKWYQPDDDATNGACPLGLSSLAANGQVIVGCRTSTTDLCLIHLGGYTSKPHPSAGFAGFDQRVWGFDLSYVPIVIPDAMDNWTLTASGSPSSTTSITDGALQITAPLTALGNQVRYEYDLGNLDPDRGCWVRYRVRTDDTVTGNGWEQIHFVDVVLADASGTDSRGFRLSSDKDTLRLYQRDDATTFTLLDTVSFTSGYMLEVIAATLDGVLMVWTRTWDPTYTDATVPEQMGSPTEREFVATNGSGYGLPDISSAFGAGTARLQFGSFHDAFDVAEFYELHFAGNTSAPPDVAEMMVPTYLPARAYSTQGTYLGDGVTLTMSGLAEAGDTWTVADAYDYGLEAVEDPSPRRTAKLTPDDASTDRTITWSLSSYHGASDVLGIAFIGSNVGVVGVEVQDASGTWTDFGDVQLAIGPLDASARGAYSVVSAGSDTTDMLFRDGEFDGAEFCADTEHGGSYGTTFRITNTYGGKWGTEASGSKPASLRLSTAGTSVSVAAPPTTWAGSYILPRDAVVLLSLQGILATGVRLTLHPTDDDQPWPLGNTWHLGRVLIGPVLPFPEDTSWGRILETTPNVDVATARDGTRRTRVNGPARRSVEFSWVDAIDTRGASQDTDDPTAHYLDPLGEPVGLERMTPWTVEAIQGWLNGAHQQCVYLPRIESLTEDATVLNRRHQLIFGRVVTPVRLESVQGDEGVDEVFRIPSLTIEEEV
ncbi:MAG: hypothetical protein H6733_10230 [Alphaproteobacteria bacterium]|nr:hypothetical protein [Alphaproteobacteria bacterium]